MKAAVVTRYGAPEVMEIRDEPRPVIAAKGILVRVRAIGLNFADIFARFGVYPGIPSPPFIPGLEFSGDVESVGSDVTLFRGGERVMGYSRLGSHAEYVTLNECFAAEIPAPMSYCDAAAFLATGMTAHHALVRLAGVRKGERVLIHAAAGGVGVAALQIARAAGAEIFATAGSPAKVSFAREHGAHHAMNYQEVDFAGEVRRLTGGYGVDVVIDSVGGNVYRKSWKLLAQMGRYVILGISDVAGGGRLNYGKVAKAFVRMPPVFPQTLMSSNKAIMGFNLGTLKGRETYLREIADELVRLYHQGSLKPVVGTVFPFDRIVEAHRYLQERKAIGKVVITLP